MHSKQHSLIGIVMAFIAITVVAALSFTMVEANGRPEQLQIDVCHATGSDNNPYSSLNVNVNSVEDAQNVGGHGNHKDDIWGPYTYGGINYPGQGDLSILENGCEVPPPPPPVVPGCTDPEALNFNPQATVDDGSCQYPPPPPPTYDACPNLYGIQETIPDGMVQDVQGNCIPEEVTVEICVPLGDNEWGFGWVPENEVESYLTSYPGSFVVDEDHPCPPQDNEPTPPPPHRKPPTVVVPPQGYVGPGADQITVWSNLPTTGVGWLINGSIIYTDLNGNEAFDGGDELIVTPIEYRDRWNRATNSPESQVQMSRLVLGSTNGNVDPNDYRAFDAQRYLDTGEIVIVGVWMETNDEHAQPEDFGSAAHAGRSVYVGDETGYGERQPGDR